VREFSAIIDPPHATILVAGSIERRPPETEDGGFEFTSRMTVTLSSDQPHGRRRGRRRTARQGFIEAPVRIVV
jgi:pyruvate/2-oxoglutarate dehydrogenase complex dihydrolipoamide acyltransferase (E2) component